MTVKRRHIVVLWCAVFLFVFALYVAWTSAIGTALAILFVLPGGLLLACTARHRKIWALFGIYAALGMFLQTLCYYGRATRFFWENEAAASIAGWLVVLYCASALVLCLVRRKQLLLFLAYGGSEEAKRDKQESWKREQRKFAKAHLRHNEHRELIAAARREATQQSASASTEAPQDASSAQPESSAAEQQPGQALDVNSCSVQELLALPGMSPAAAERAVRLRQEEPYKSEDDFIARNQIKPHFAVRLLPLIHAEETAAKSAGSSAKRRGLDI